MKELMISLADIYIPDEFHKRLEDYLPLPDYYGANLDALHDVLTTLPGEWHIRFTECAEAEAMMDKYMKKLKKMCANACLEKKGLGIEFEA